MLVSCDSIWDHKKWHFLFFVFCFSYYIKMNTIERYFRKKSFLFERDANPRTNFYSKVKFPICSRSAFLKTQYQHRKNGGSQFFSVFWCVYTFFDKKLMWLDTEMNFLSNDHTFNMWMPLFFLSILKPRVPKLTSPYESWHISHLISQY